MNCSSSWEVLDSSRWLSSGEHSVSYSPERGCQWWTDPWGMPATHIFKSHQACCSFFSPSPMEVENPQDSEVDSEVLGLKYPFVCLLYTSVSSVGRSFCIHHFMVLTVSASLPLRLFWFEVTMLSLEVLFFFFFLRKWAEHYDCVIIDGRWSNPVLNNCQHKTDADCFRKPWKLWFYTLAHPTLLHKREQSSKKIFFCTWPYNQTSSLMELIIDVDQMSMVI